MSKKENIKKCAIALFQQYGYKSVTADMIVNEAKVSKGLLFFHYKNMEGLISEIMLDWLIPKWELMIALDLKNLPLKKCIEKIFELSKTGLDKQKSQYKLYFSIMLNEPNFISKLNLENNEVYKKMLACLHSIYESRNVENAERELILFNTTLMGAEMSYCIHTQEVGDYFYKTTKEMFLKRYELDTTN